MSDADLKFLRAGSIGLGKQPEVNANIADALIVSKENRAARQQFLKNYVELNGHENGADRMWQRYLAANPIFDPARKETFGLNTMRQDWQGWFKSAIDPQTGKLRPETAPAGGGLRWNPATGRVEGG
jgi:hypothetical protein